jgi:hypothetical protein
MDGLKPGNVWALGSEELRSPQVEKEQARMLSGSTLEKAAELEPTGWVDELRCHLDKL